MKKKPVQPTKNLVLRKVASVPSASDQKMIDRDPVLRALAPHIDTLLVLTEE